MPPLSSIMRNQVLLRFPKARIHRLEDGRAQVINPVGNGLFEAVSDAVGSRYFPGKAARYAWSNAFKHIRQHEGDPSEKCSHGVAYNDQCQDCEEEEEGRMLDEMDEADSPDLSMNWEK